MVETIKGDGRHISTGLVSFFWWKYHFYVGERQQHRCQRCWHPAQLGLSLVLHFLTPREFNGMKHEMPLKSSLNMESTEKYFFK